MLHVRPTLLANGAVAVCLLVSQATAQCPEEPALQNWVGGGNVTCPCFVAGEEAGSILNIPAQHLPAEILRVGIGWGSQFGGAPATVEEAIKIYQGGLPNPGAPIATLPAPQMTDGFINEFDVEPLPGEIIVTANPVTVTLQFFNDNANQIFAPSVVHDGTGCQPGKSVVKAIPGGWFDSCTLGLTGQWQFHIIYRPVNCGGGNQTYCVGAPNSTGVGAQIGFFGSTSLAANDLILTCSNGPVNSPGLFFYGPNQVQIPFGDGFRCVGGQIFRVPPPQFFDVFGNLAHVFDNDAPPANGGSGAITAGSSWNFQCWYRDVPAGMSGFNLSNGLALDFTP